MSYKLICLDLDGVVFNTPGLNIWMEIHKAFNTLKQGKELTEKYLTTDYKKLVQEVVEKLWKGKDAEPYYKLINSIPYNPGAKEFFQHLKSKGYIIAIISASSAELARRIEKEHNLPIDHIYANDLIIKDNKVAGEFVWPIAEGTKEKPKIIQDLCNDLKIKTSEVIYIGDLEKDEPAFRLVGHSIAFNTKSEKLKQAATIIVDSNNLKDTIKHLPV